MITMVSACFPYWTSSFGKCLCISCILLCVVFLLIYRNLLYSPMGVSLHSLSQHRDTSGSFLFYFNVDILHTWLQPPWRLFLRVFNIPSGLCTIIYFALLLLLDGWPVFKSLTPLRSGLAS